MKKVSERDKRNKSINSIMEHEGKETIEEMLTGNQARFVQAAVDTEIDEFLGRKHYEHGDSSKGYRNGFYFKDVELPGAAFTIKRTTFRNTKEKFVSRVLKGIAHISDKIKTMALEMYVRGLSTRDIEATLVEADGTPMFSKSGVSILAKRLYGEYLKFSQRDLSEFDVVYLFVDGVYESVRRYTNNQTLLCAWAILSDGRKEFLHLCAVESESTEAWEMFFSDMKNRGLRQPLLIISDGAAGVIAATEKHFPKADRQRCIAHKLRNIAAKLPRDVQKVVLEEIKSVYYASDHGAAKLLASNIIEKYGEKYSSAIRCFSDDLDACLVHLKYPLGHRKYIRTTNLMERAFEEEKRRTKVFPQHQHEKSALGLVFAVLIRASQKWQRVSMSDIELVQLKHIRSLMQKKNESQNYISYQLAV